jgi:hypothetical protein
MSGVALQTERQLLNAKLSDISDTLRETELAMWSIWLDWQALNMPEDFHIDYPDTFDMRDEHLELDFLMKTRSAGINNSEFDKEISRQIVALAVDDVEIQAKILNDMSTESEEDFEVHTMTDPRTGKNVIVRSQAEHLALMDQGFTLGGE